MERWTADTHEEEIYDNLFHTRLAIQDLQRDAPFFVTLAKCNFVIGSFFGLLPDSFEGFLKFVHPCSFVLWPE